MRLIDADALMKRHLPNCIGRYDEKASKSFNFFLGYEHAVSGIREVVKTVPTVNAIPVEWLRQKAEENSHYAEPYFAFAYVLHEWQQTKSIEELQAESEMRDWKAEQEANHEHPDTPEDQS